VKCNLATGINATFDPTHFYAQARDLMLDMSVSELSNRAENKIILLLQIPTAAPSLPDDSKYVIDPSFDIRDCVTELLHFFLRPNEKPFAIHCDLSPIWISFVS
jgi:hypothetical protein